MRSVERFWFGREGFCALILFVNDECESNATFGSTDEISSPDRAHIASVAVDSRSADPSLSRPFVRAAGTPCCVSCMPRNMALRFGELQKFLVHSLYISDMVTASGLFR